MEATKHLDSGICLTFHHDLFASSPSEHTQNVFSIIELVRLLKVSARTSISSKNDHPLFSPSVFKNVGPTGYRMKANFLAVSCLVLDFDGGNLSPEKFEEIFWHQAGPGRKRTFIICNTFSATSASPNRFRVIMPFKKPVTSIEVFEKIYNSIVQRIEEAGYSKELSKLDKRCSCPTHSWYLPCTNRSEKGQAFIRTHGTQTRDFERHGIDPAQYEVTLPRVQPHKTDLNYDLRQAKDNSVKARQDIDSEKQKLKGMTCDRHTPFFDLGVLMRRKYGYPLDEVERELLDVAGSDPKMKKWVRDAMRSLRKPRP